MAPTRAIIVIDVQNEFMFPLGNFPIPTTCKESITSNLRALVPQFRESGGHIIWVKAEYPNRKEEPACMSQHPKNSNEWIAAGTHVHATPCCEAGSFGAEIDPEVVQLMEEGDVVVVKKWYSAFHEDCEDEDKGEDKGERERGKRLKLREVLKEREVKEAYFCGLASNTCVLATLIHAVRIEGLSVFAVVDCMGYRRLSAHEEAIKKMEGMELGLVDSRFVVKKE